MDFREDIWSAAGLLRVMLVILLLVSGCSPRTPGHRAKVENKPGTSTSITVFGDARLGVAIN